MEKLIKMTLSSVKVTESMRASITAAQSLEWTPAQTAAGTALMLVQGVAVVGTLIATHL